MPSAIAIALLLTLLTTPVFGAGSEAGAAPGITPHALQARLQSGEPPLVVDMRAPAEFAIGHIPGALNVPHDQVQARHAELVSPHGIVAYCTAGGPRSRQGEAALLGAGRRSVLHLEGGLAAWQDAGLPIEAGR